VHKGTDWHYKSGYKGKGGGKSKAVQGKDFGKGHGREMQKGAKNKGNGKGSKGGKYKSSWRTRLSYILAVCGSCALSLYVCFQAKVSS